MPDLQKALDDYAVFYDETYGVAEPAAELVPPMRTAFLESDRAFQRWRKG